MSDLKKGLYRAENDDSIYDAYDITIDVTETEKSFVFVLKDFSSRYAASHIEMLFSKSKRAVISKAKSGHAMRIWGDDSFTLYPFQAGIPYYFKYIEQKGKRV